MTKMSGIYGGFPCTFWWGGSLVLHSAAISLCIFSRIKFKQLKIYIILKC